MYRTVLKNIVDRVGAAIVLLVLAIPMIFIAIFVWQCMGWPFLFRQQRPGLHGKAFWLYKFRTMTDRRDADGSPLPDADRLTAFGRFLRRTSLDELPEFVNVLKGDMSLVGPRPLLIEYLELYNPDQARRHEVKPGITGWAQVHGRNAVSWEQRFQLDVWYVDHVSFRLDLKILRLTVMAVLSGEGVEAPGHATVPRFQGSASEPPLQGRRSEASQ